MHTSKKQGIMKYLYLLFIVLFALSFGSCKKESLSNTSLNNTAVTSAEADAMALKQQAAVVKYGAQIGAPDGKNQNSFEKNIANQLGILYLRERVSVPAASLTPNLVPELNTKFKVVLNFSSPSNGGGTPAHFRKDTAQYKKDLNDVLNTFTTMPVVAVIENEEPNNKFYSGPAKDYINQLKAAIEVMHARNIKVANGGLISFGLNYLVYKDLLAQGKADSALLFLQQTNVAPDSSQTQQAGATTDTLITNYAKMQLNYVNFHRKLLRPADSISLNQVINYLKKRTGKEIISNELGQLDYDTLTLLSDVRTCTRQAFPYILWYSPDQDAGKRGTPLQYPDATLTPTGIAYKNYLATK